MKSEARPEPPAAAATEVRCEPLAEAELADRIHASLDAIQRADVEGHRAIIRDLWARVPCLEFVPQTQHWAELLVGIAIVEYASKGSWEGPLATALHLQPDVDLLVGPSHAFRAWTPPSAPASTGFAVPQGVRIYLDGELISEIPETTGLHLAQRRTGDGWSSILLEDEPLPADWLVEPELSKVRLRPALTAGVLTGGIAAGQRVDSPGDWIGDTDTGRLSVGVGTAGTIGYGAAGGIYWDLALPDVFERAPAYGHLGIFWPFGHFAPFLGGGGQFFRAEAGGEAQTWLLPFPVLGLRWVGEGRVRPDAAVSAAWTPAVARGQASFGLSPGSGPVRWRIGLDLGAGQASLEQEGSGRRLRARSLSAGMQVGLALGTHAVVRKPRAEPTP